MSKLFQSTHPVWDATVWTNENVFQVLRISIHASRMGCDSSVVKDSVGRIIDFNPRIPYGMRPAFATEKSGWRQYFNPRIPYGMRRQQSRFDPVWVQEFQSTHPVWDATSLPDQLMAGRCISIHASRMGCDVSISSTVFCLPGNFNPRIPYGMRLPPQVIAFGAG